MSRLMTEENKCLKHRIILVLTLGMITFTPMKAQKPHTDYTVEDGIAYYQGEPLESADTRTFSILGAGYAKDAFHVYMNGKSLPYVDPATFRIITPNQEHNTDCGDFHRDGGYFKSTFDVFFNGRKIEGATASSFQVLDGGYAKDSFTVFYFGKEVKGASANSFVYDGRGYAHDTFNTYFHGKEISN